MKRSDATTKGGIVTMTKPSDLPQKKALDPVKRRGRSYGLGERNPKTLPGFDPRNESLDDNARASKVWTRRRKFVQSVASVGVKY